jgi:predicted transposase/invertase (TIGR01784 family)
MEAPIPHRFIDPLTDWGFKRIFGSEPNKDLLIDFLNQLFLGERQIVDLVYNKNEHAGPLAGHRKAIFDLLCTGSTGEQFIIEVQRVKQEYFKDRCLFYASTLIRDQAPSGTPGWDYQLKPVYLIGLMDFTFDEKNAESCVHRIHLMKTDSCEIFYDKLGFTFIELPKFIKTETELVSELDYWLFLLTNLSKLDKIPLFFEKACFQ